MVKVEEPDPLTEAGTKEADAPKGDPLREKLTVSENPLRGLMEAVYEAFPPCTTDWEEGVAEMEKSGAGLTVMARVGGLGSVKPALSVTVSVAVKAPGAE
jgi:hypothetical protein